MSGPVTRVVALSTGSVRIRPQHVASSGTPELWWMLTARAWTEPLPINVYLIEHRAGLVLFDAGQDCASVVDPDYFPKGPLRSIYRRLAEFAIDADQRLPQLMRAAGYDVADVRATIVSHLHQDHIGALADLGHTDIYVSEREWQTLEAPFPELKGVMRRHIDLQGLRWQKIAFAPSAAAPPPFDACHDVMGDGSLVLVPTPGHTPGSMSLLVRDGVSAPLLLVGDLTYSCDLMHEGIVPGVGHVLTLHASSQRVLELERNLGGLTILAAHDPSAARRLSAHALGA